MGEGKAIDLDVTLDTFGLFARAGCIIPVYKFNE